MFGRPTEALVRRVDQIEDPIARDRGRPRKTMGKIIKKELNFNGLIVDMIYNKTL